MTDASGAVTEALPEPGSKRRQIRPKAERRQQLIDATIRCIAQHGLSAVTMQMVTREAGLSVGIANLHFESKDNLLKETLRFVAEAWFAYVCTFWYNCKSLRFCQKNISFTAARDCLGDPPPHP